MVSTTRTIVLAFGVLALSACGFHLRGSPSLPQEFDKILLQMSQSSDFSRALERQLKQRGKMIVKSVDEASATIVIHEDDSGQRILSVTATEGPEEYEVFHVVRYSLVVNEQTRIHEQELTLTRDYTYDKNRVLGKAHEYESLREALAMEMAETLIRRLGYSE